MALVSQTLETQKKQFMKKLFLLLSAVITANLTQSQNFLGYANSNYAGVSGIDLQPASIADSRYRFDMTLLGLDLSMYNNYIGMRPYAIKPFKKDHWNETFNDDLFQTKYLLEDNSKNVKQVYLNAEVVLPSFMLSLSPKSSFAITTRLRNFVNVDGIESKFAKLIYEGFDYPDFWIQNIQNDAAISVQTMSWMEYGFNYAQVVMDEEEHFVKVGGRIKILQGLQSAYVYIPKLKYSVQNEDTLDVFKTEVHYGHSTNFEADENSIEYKFESYPTLGFDMGAVYEWRPDWQSFKYDMDGETNLWRRDKNKYKLRIGASVLDMGRMRYVKGYFSGDFYADVQDWCVACLDPGNVADIDDTIRNRFSYLSSNNVSYLMALPTAASIQVDYNIWKDFYVNLTPYYTFQRKNRESKVHGLSAISFTPRWDHKWFGVFVPLSYNQLGKFRGGLSLRLGPIIVGSTNLTPLISNNADIYGVDLHLLAKIPVPFGKPKDRDKDKVSDKKDQCKDTPGVWQFMGCPDTDGDGIKDSEDRCPEIFGLAEFRGCPDTDGDKIPDIEDDCPDVPGIPEFKGCPDTDGDGIKDSEDKCPELAGPKELNGCPDTDGDGLIDPEDLCPEHAGPIENQGCPDHDGDGLLDHIDECPDVPGPKENSGCPWPDTDKDGIIDKEDMCPTVPGVPEYRGCPPPPPMKEKERKIIEKAFSSLEFATAKDIIKPVSFPSLNDLAKLLIEHKNDWKITLSGHTDNQGDDDKNMLLSEKRSKSVKAYLMKKGVPEENIITEWFGETKPIADNDTPAGRQKNRRVEMKVTFVEVK